MLSSLGYSKPPATNRRKSASDALDMSKGVKSRTLSLGGSYNYRTRVKADQEPFSVNLKVFDRQIQTLREVCRDDVDQIFQEQVWGAIRGELQKIHDSHSKHQPYQQPLLDETTVTRRVRDADYIRKLERTIRSLLLPLNALAWAEKLQVHPDVILTEFLYAAASGIVEMWWGPECNGCGGATVKESSLQDIAMEQTCQNCGWLNQTKTLDEIKVQFVLHEDILYLPNLLFDFPDQTDAPKMSKFCFGLYAPPTTNGTKWAYDFGLEEEEEEEAKEEKEDPIHMPSKPALQPGRYRFHCSYSRVNADIVVERQATTHDETIEFNFIATEQTCPARYGLPRTVSYLEHGKVSLQLLADVASVMNPLVFYNLTQEDETIFFHKDNAPYITATQCLHLACFGRLFGKQVVCDACQFVIQRVTLVFTDVVSSTQLYSDAGDGLALNCVKEHFQVLFQAFTKRGRIVKTIGDAVMGAFTSPKAALLATAQALDEMQHVKRPCGGILQIRIGVHSGPALMVSLNGTNDYFGSTVNIAARVESQAHGGEVLVSQAVLEDPMANELFEELAEEGRFTRQVSLELKGVDGLVIAMGFGPKRDSESSSSTSSTASMSSHVVENGNEDTATVMLKSRGVGGSRKEAMQQASKQLQPAKAKSSRKQIGGLSQRRSEKENGEVWV
ncbi:Receptor-type adenylate cyclase [Seminavis robusta]|uniref:Receptor-type adenylate cyclase n=1 Tax=Seminavis robusta TaxID=568900 RepID=A0A9N8H6A5_9STRA|nr:Receptor-type adenylate cyclase [Seminavis robusta]|eukprot:Sro40_g024520.1 Receptor-type adenylate cyclase (672) ;mRNA; f:24116-26131